MTTVNKKGNVNCRAVMGCKLDINQWFNVDIIPWDSWLERLCDIQVYIVKHVHTNMCYIAARTPLQPQCAAIRTVECIAIIICALSN